MDSVRYPSDCSDEEWAFAAPYLTLMREDAPQRVHSLRELFNGLRYIVRAGSQWRMMPKDLPPWKAVYDQTQRWIAAGVFEAMANDLRKLLRLARGRKAEPSAAILDGRTLRSTPESGARAGFDGHKKTKGSKVHLAVDTLGHLLALTVTKASEGEGAGRGALQEGPRGDGVVGRARLGGPGLHGRGAEEGRREGGDPTGGREAPRGQEGVRAAPQALGRRAVLRLGKPLARDHERLAESLAGYHVLAFAVLMLVQAVPLLESA